MFRTKYIFTFLVIGLILLIVAIPDAVAQCPMCKMAAESNLKGGGSGGKGLNIGILFMLCLPYVIIGSLGYAWYRNQKKTDEEQSVEVA